MVVTVEPGFDGAVPGALTDGVLTDGVETEGVLTDGVETEGVLTDGAETDGALTEGVEIEGADTDGTEPAVLSGVLTETEDRVPSSTVGTEPASVGLSNPKLAAPAAVASARVPMTVPTPSRWIPAGAGSNVSTSSVPRRASR